MKLRKRMTRQQSKELTRVRLVEAAERIFIRKGFDDASVEEISEAAGYSRGAFYSNFKDKDQVLLAVIDRLRPKALDGIFQRLAESAERIVAVREWFSNQWRFRDFITLQIEISRRAMRDRSVRKHLAELRRRELETYAASVNRYLGATDGLAAEKPEVVALVLLAVAHGLGSIAIDTDAESEDMYADAAKLAFDRLTTSQAHHIE